MKVTELRIGNYLKSGQVTSLNLDHITLHENHQSDIYKESEVEPIQLNAEWLEIFGLDKRVADNGNNIIHVTEVMLEDESVAWRFYRNNEPLGNLLYVHQLQNLYFALTGEELTIK